MSTISNANNPNNAGLKVNVGLSVQRQTPKTDFGSIVGKGLNTAADIAIQGTNIASAFIPGGSVVSAAVTGLGQMKDSFVGQGANANSLANTGGISYSGTPGSVGGGSVVGGGRFDTGGGGVSADVAAQREMMEMNQSFNMQYLGLQQEMQAENRKFTALSNIMKTRHDTAKNAISNVR